MAIDTDHWTGNNSGEKHALFHDDTAFSRVARVFLDYARALSQPANAANRTRRKKAEAALRALDDSTLSTFVLPPCPQPDEALAIAKILVRLMPRRAAVHFALGLALQAAGRHADAIAPYRHALALDPGLPGLRQRGRLASALLNTGAQPPPGDAARDEVIQLFCDILAAGHDNERSRAWGALAWDNFRQFRFGAQDLERIVVLFRCALERNPHSSSALNHYSILLRECQRWDEAERMARLACQYAPEDTILRTNLGTLLLLRGYFVEGFHAYEQRWDEVLRATRPDFTQPRWRGEPLAGRTLLLWGEQGKGDALLGSRYVPLLAERVQREGGRLVWGMFSGLTDLFRRSFHGHYDDFFVGDSVQVLPQHDLEVSLLSLPFLFGTREDTIPGPVRYLSSEPVAAARWRELLAGEKRLKVGLAWMGTPENERNTFRSVGLAAYVRHFAALGEDVAFYSLQPNADDEIAAARAAGFEITDYSAGWKTFDDTAAFVDTLDLVITVCTSIAHLSGALGQHTWVLLDVNPYWVWQLERRDSPWYPGTTLYRQKEIWQWEPVLETVMADLKVLAQKHRAS